MPHPAPLLVAAAIALAGAAATPTSATTPLAGAADFDAAIARLEQHDPQDPQALNARLQYAGFLTDAAIDADSGAPTGDCQARLDAAQGQLDAVAARPATQILLPLGQARLDGGAYKIHAARAQCDAGGDAAARSDELHKALDAATKAARDYHDGLDYQSAAIMQFNIAVTLHDLGNTSEAIAALQTAIATDRTFGFHDDAQDNIRLLQHWQGGDESDAKIAELMKDFPAPHTTNFNFAWAAGDTHETIAATETSLTGGKAGVSKGSIALERHVRPYKMGWAVSTDTGAKPTLDSGHWAANGSAAIQRFTAYMLALALLETPDYTVTATGDFDALHAPANYSKALTADVVGAIGAPQFQQGAGVDAATAKVLTQNLTVAVLPLYLETATAQNYSLQTATWAGAKLQQGMWYQMTAPLLLPGMGLGQYFLVTHNIAFSYARAVPCTPQDTAASCAEIVIHATPDPADFTKAHVQMSSLYHMPNFDALHYWSSINMRVVLKPDSLTPVVSDVRRSWYIAIDGVADLLISSERVVTTTTDH